MDDHDVVCYYSATKDRIFPRSPGIIGRKVQNCHPPKSIDIVTRILDAFRAGTEDDAVFWIEQKGRLILISYYAIRDNDGLYKGTIEVTQDVSTIRGLEGERRLLDWEKDVK